MRRVRYQFGALDRKARKKGPDVWVYRYRENGIQRSKIVGTVKEFPKPAQAWKAAEVLRLEANPDNAVAQGVTFGALLDRYIKDEMPKRFSTAGSYGAWIRAYIRPKWGEYLISQVKPLAVEQWLKSLALAPKSLGHIKGVMRVVFDCAMRLELCPMEINPMQKVRIEGGTGRISAARVLDASEVRLLVSHIPEEPFRTMAWLSVCLGLERSVLAALQWGDFDFSAGLVSIQRGIVENRVAETKNKHRSKVLPLDPALKEMLLEWKKSARWTGAGDWVFASPWQNGRKPYSPRHVARIHFWPAAKAAGLGEKIGWQSFRRTYSSLLRRLGVDMKVQQELMRHADIRTTMNLYTEAFSDDLRQAHGSVTRELIH